MRVLDPGARVPDVQVWASPREEARPLRDFLGEDKGRALLASGRVISRHSAVARFEFA